MSLILDIQEHLTTTGVTGVVVNREAEINCLPATEVRVYVDSSHNGVVLATEHIFHFAKANGLNGRGMAGIIDSYIKSTDAALA